jgi:flagellar biosynthesis protein FlhB
MTEASEFRIQASENRGEFPVSQGLTRAATLVAVLCSVSFVTRSTQSIVNQGISNAVHASEASEPTLSFAPLVVSLVDALRATAPTLCVSMLTLALTHSLQSRFVFTWFQAENSVRLSVVRAAVWVLAIASAAVFGIWRVMQFPKHVDALAGAVAVLCNSIAWSVAVIALALGLLEFFWLRAQHLASLTPSRSEHLAELRDNRGSDETRKAMHVHHP